MPITLPPITRRQFISRSIAALAGTMVVHRLFAAGAKIDPHRYALLADTHINADAGKMIGATNMTDNFKRVAGELTGLDSLPAGAFVVGDLAHVTGESGDYGALMKLLRPIREARMPVHLALGNHDERDRFWKALPPGEKAVVHHHVAIVKAARANFFILDSLDKTNQVAGRCGEDQLKWLADSLDAHADKPAITLVHHNPDTHKNITGLLDTEALWKTLLPRRQVKLLLFGHTHDWRVNSRDGLHLVNLPPTAYVFGKDRPNGWVDLQLEHDSARLELHALNPDHPESSKPLTLRWR